MDTDHKKILKALSLKLRHLLEGKYDASGQWHAGDIERRLNGLGIWRDRVPLPADELSHLTPADRQAREVVDAYLALRLDAAIPRDQAVAEPVLSGVEAPVLSGVEAFVRETAYTWANRLLALRCMEARELIDEVILQKPVYGDRSLEHHRLARRNPELCMGEDDGLFAVLEQAFERQAKRLPLLFDPQAPAVALKPSVAALKRCVALLSGAESVKGQEAATDEVFRAPDALGWAYQYWNTEEKNRVFEKVRTQKGAKIAGADIIPATQLYTEPYMVKFLVQNSLGATWIGMYPESHLYEGWEYYVRDADRAPVERKPVREITFLDPAVGSGHFLLEAFDLFYDMYLEEGEITDPDAICASILQNNLFGIDIDERAVQIAEAALWMKSAERTFDFHGASTNLVATNICLPKRKDHLETFLAKYPEDAPLRPALEVIFEGLQHADELGSLLQIEEPVEQELRRLQAQYADAVRRGVQIKMFEPTAIQGELPIGVESYEEWKALTLARLKEHFAAEAQAADLAQYFFSRSVSKGLALFDLLARRYDVVAANPPYMGSKNMGEIVKQYLTGAFPLGKADLYSCFIEQSFHLSVGYVTMITLNTWMFLQSFVQLRQHILSSIAIETIVQLGRYAFSEADPPGNVCMVVFGVSQPASDHALQSFRIKQPVEASSQATFLEVGVNGRFSSSQQMDFLGIDGYPLSLGVTNRLLKITRDETALGGDVDSPAQVVMGSSTKNDSRFLRWFWEVDGTGQRWQRFTKGGRYQKWCGLETHYVDWEMDGIRPKTNVLEKYLYLKGNYGWVIKYEDLHFLPGITYTNMARGSLGCRLMDETIPGHSSHAIYIKKDTRAAWLGLLNTHVVSALMRIITQSLTFETGYVAKLPVVEPEGLESLGYAAIQDKRALVCLDPLEHSFDWFSFFPSGPKNLWDFIYTYIHNSLSHTVSLLVIEGEIERLVCDLYQLDQESRGFVTLETGILSAWLPFLNGYSALPISVIGRLAEIEINLESIVLEEDHSGKTKTKQQRLVAMVSNESGGKDLIKAFELFAQEEVDNKEEKTELEFSSGRPIPTESLLEELSIALGIHPISVYWLLFEGIEESGWRIVREERRITADLFIVTILHLLGHRWPKQVEAGESIPAWADADGIIPLTEATGEPTLLERVRERIARDFIAEEFEGGDVTAIEREFEEIMGKPLERWLTTEFFKHHTRQFKKRPIAWQIQSGRFTARQKPAFACLVYYHKLDGATLATIQSQYIRPLRQRYETEQRGIESISAAARSARQDARRVELEAAIHELRDFDAALEQVATQGFASQALVDIVAQEPLDRWCSIDGVKPPPEDREALLRQEQSYIPDINDGVRVNVAPLQKAGLLAAKVLSAKDVDKAIADRAEWRADERRWCREGKLPRPGWWAIKKGK